MAGLGESPVVGVTTGPAETMNRELARTAMARSLWNILKFKLGSVVEECTWEVVVEDVCKDVIIKRGGSMLRRGIRSLYTYLQSGRCVELPVYLLY